MARIDADEDKFSCLIRANPRHPRHPRSVSSASTGGLS